MRTSVRTPFHRAGLLLALTQLSLLAAVFCFAVERVEAVVQNPIHQGVVLVGDDGPYHPTRPGRMVLADLDAGEIIATVRIGSEPDFALSADGTLLAVVSGFVVDDGQRYEHRLQVYKTVNLKRLADGALPFSDRYTGAQWICDKDIIAFGDGNRVVIVPRPTRGNGNLNVLRWSPVEWQALGAEEPGVYPFAARWKDCIGPVTSRLPVVSTKGWPVMDVCVHWAEEFQSFDFKTGRFVGRIRFDEGEEGPRCTTNNTSEQVQPKRIALTDREKHWAFVFPGQGSPGRIAKLNLLTGRVVRISDQEIVSGRPYISAVSGQARSVFVADVSVGSGSTEKPPARIRVFDSETLEERSAIEPEADYFLLDTSFDGAHLYVVGRQAIHVYDTRSMRPLHSITQFGKSIGTFLAVPGPANDGTEKPVGTR